MGKSPSKLGSSSRYLYIRLVRVYEVTQRFCALSRVIPKALPILSHEMPSDRTAATVSSSWDSIFRNYSPRALMVWT
jgi:hypothetical protein